MSKLEIYTRATCPYCIRAKQLLDTLGIAYDENAVEDQSLRTEMIQRTGGRSTVPQIFIDGKLVGGCDDLFRLEKSGELTKLLAA